MTSKDKENYSPAQDQHLADWYQSEDSSVNNFRDPDLIKLWQAEQKSNESRPDLSIIIPAYNEAARLPTTLLLLVAYLEREHLSYEIIVVNDGSSDDTAELVNGFTKLKPEVRLINLPANQGKGAAVRTGVLRAGGERILFYDADGATPIGELPRLMNAMEMGADVAIGSRALASADTKVKTYLYRMVMGRIFSAIVKILILPGIADTQCGFKMFSYPVARYLFSRQTANGWSFDVELLFLARRAGCRIAEIPVNWTNIPGSKVHLVKDSFKMLTDIIRFRINYLRGKKRTNTIEEEIKGQEQN